MPQTLYQFGIDPSDPSSKNSTPKSIATGEEIKILWSSWCDLIYTTVNASKARTIVYAGKSLSQAQQEDIISPQSTIEQGLADPTCRSSFFGSSMHDGVRGYICGWRLTVFSTLAEQAGSEQAVGMRDLLAFQTGEVQMCSDNSVLLCLPSAAPAFTKTSAQGSIAIVPHPKYLGSRSAGAETNEVLADFAPTQLVVNATTATVLSSTGTVFTRTTDPRYPSTLGRPDTGTSRFEPVPYLSETCIKKIASGGYMTAAISEDGELFLWGQSDPGTVEELGVLERLDYDADATVKKETVIWGDTIQDDDVKVLKILINGRDATAYDVAIGFGHILVAAKDETGKHAMFAAGCGGEGQLGTGKVADYEREFTEVVVLRGKRVKQLTAVGWSSFIVTQD